MGGAPGQFSPNFGQWQWAGQRSKGASFQDTQNVWAHSLFLAVETVQWSFLVRNRL